MEVAGGIPVALGLVDFEETMGFETLTADGAGSFPCPNGGSATALFQTDVAPPGTFSTGDVFAVTFSSCMLDPSLRISGSIVIGFNLVNGDWLTDPVWEVDLDFDVNSLVMSSGPSKAFFDASWNQYSSYNNGDATFALTGDFTTSLSNGTVSQISAFSGLTFTYDYDSAAMEHTYTVDGTFASSELGGAVTLETLAPVVRADADVYANSGVLRATGAGGSTLTFTILDETSVQLDVDADGDMMVDYQVIVDWFDLEG